jgi:hypothetical protein
MVSCVKVTIKDAPLWLTQLNEAGVGVDALVAGGSEMY